MTPSASRATTPVANTETFDPVRPIVDPADSVLLPISKVPTYLDAALKALTLHTEARTSFITSVSSFFLRFFREELKAISWTQLLAPRLVEARVRRAALHRAGCVRASCVTAHRASTGRRHACVYALPRGRGGRPRTLGSHGHWRGRADVLGGHRWR